MRSKKKRKDFKHITVTHFLRVTCAHSIRGGVEEMEECGKEQDEDTMPVDFFCQVIMVVVIMMKLVMISMMTRKTRTPCPSTSFVRR